MRKALSRVTLTFDTLAATFFATLSLVAIVLGLSEDHLFLLSEWTSLAEFLLLTAFWTSVPVAVLLLAASLVRGRRAPERLPLAASAAAFGVVGFGFSIFFLLDSMIEIREPEYLLWLFIALSPLAPALAWAGWKRKLSLDAFRLAIRVVFVVACTTMFWNLATRITRWSAPALSERPPVHTIMIVIDALSPDDLSTFNASMDTPDFEAIASDSVHFDEARTNFADTFGFFSIFYAGLKSGDSSRKSLLGLLREHGVNTRWITFHNNGLPRGEANRAGLRGGFATQHAAPWLGALGLDYNVFWYRRPQFRGKVMSVRESRLTHWVNGERPDRSLFREVVPDEVEHLRAEGRDFFLLVHTNTTAMVEAPPGLWESTYEGRQKRELAEAEMRKLDYIYLPRHEPFITEILHNRDAQIRTGLRELRAFFDEFRRRSWDRDTLLIVTADHGSLRLKRGRVWYAYHHDEEVSRVPLLLSGLGLHGRDGELRQTIDLTQTILQRHGISERLSDDAVPLFQEPPAERVVTTLTRRSSLRNEQFLSAYRGHFKYVVDLENPRTARVFEVQGFDLLPVEEGVIESETLPFSLDEVLRDYRWKRGERDDG